MTVGTVIALDGSPSTYKFAFVVEPGSKVRKGEYIEAESEQGIVFGYVNEITRANRYFERAESVAEYERVGGMKKNFPVDSWDYMVGEVRILGAFTDGMFLRAFIPPKPGSKVMPAREELLKKFLGFTEDGLLLGNLQHHELKAIIDMTRLLQKHLAILAMSGSGKSHLASVMLEELLEREIEKGRIAIVVIDIHGEYIGFQADEKYSKSVKIVNGSDFRYPLRKISPEMIEEWMVNLSPPQKDLLRSSIQSLRTKKGKGNGYTLKELVEEMESSEVVGDNVKRTLKRSIRELARHRFISRKMEIPRILNDVSPGKMLIFDCSDITSLRKKQIMVSLLSRKLFNLRKKGKIPPFLLLIEEAHNFAPERAETYAAVSRSVIETIAREGRKFGASLCLISQRPVNLSTTALSQCNTHIILRITNPNDLDHIQMSSEGIDSRVAKSITSLKIGEGIIVGAAVNYPVFVNIRDRKSKKREKGAPLYIQAKEFEENQKKKDEQVEAFL